MVTGYSALRPKTPPNIYNYPVSGRNDYVIRTYLLRYFFKIVCYINNSFGIVFSYRRVDKDVVSIGTRAWQIIILGQFKPRQGRSKHISFIFFPRHTP